MARFHVKHRTEESLFLHSRLNFWYVLEVWLMIPPLALFLDGSIAKMQSYLIPFYYADEACITLLDNWIRCWIFFRHQYIFQSFLALLLGLRRSKLVQSQLLNGDHTGNGNHRGLSVMHKETATIYAYDSLLHLQAFQSLHLNIKILAESISTKFGIECSFRLQNRSVSDELSSV